MLFPETITAANSAHEEPPRIKFSGKLHRLRTVPEMFQALARGHKTAELRYDDRNYAIGDVLMLLEWDVVGGFAGLCMLAVVTHIVRGPGYGLLDKHVMMSIKPLASHDYYNDPQIQPVILNELKSLEAEYKALGQHDAGGDGR